jgi:hypothetical protein
MQDEPIVDATQAPKGKWWAKINQRPGARYLRPALGVLPPLLAVVAIVAYPESLRMKAAFVQAHLPLTLPILMVLISIGVRLKDLSSSKGWLALCNYFASGYVTFAIWALVSGQSVKQYIWINDEKVLDKSYSVPLVISAFGLLAVCSLVTVLADAADEKEKGKRGWQVVQALFVGLSLLALLFPYVLFEQKATVEARTGKSLELQAFTVSIGFRDPALNQFLGRSANPLQQCVLYSDIAAKSPENAKAAAFKTFNESDLSNQFLNPADRARDRSTRKKVEVEQAWVVAEVAASGSPGR